MIKKSIPLILAFLVIVVIIYQRYSIISCVAETKQLLKNRGDNFDSVADVQKYYDLFYKSCMGSHGFER